MLGFLVAGEMGPKLLARASLDPFGYGQGVRQNLKRVRVNHRKAVIVGLILTIQRSKRSQDIEWTIYTGSYVYSLSTILLRIAQFLGT